MFTAHQVNNMLGMPLSTLDECVLACRAQLSPATRRRSGQCFSDADVAVIAGAYAPATQGRSVVVQCAWCGKHLGLRQGHGVAGISHGMCKECSASFLADYEGSAANAAG